MRVRKASTWAWVKEFLASRMVSSARIRTGKDVCHKVRNNGD